MRGVERETVVGTGRRVELVLIKHCGASGGEGGAVRDLIFPEIGPRVADPPIANVERFLAKVAQLDRVLVRRVGVRQYLVDNHRLDRLVVRPAGGGRVGERDDRARAVRQAAFRFARLGLASLHLFDQRLGAAVQRDLFAEVGEAEVQVVAALGQVTVGDPFHEASGADEVQRRNFELGAADGTEVVGEVVAAEVHGKRVGVVQLDPVIAPAAGAPFVDDHVRSGGGEAREGVGLARGGAGQEFPVPVFVPADGGVGDLKTVVDAVDDLFLGIEQVDRAVCAAE